MKLERSQYGSRLVGGCRRRGFLAVLATLWTLLLAAASPASALQEGVDWSGIFDQSKSVSEWNLIEQSGSKIYRLGIFKNDWAALGASQYDEVFKQAAEHDVTVLPYLVNGGYPQSGEPAYEQWYLWCKELVKRYGHNGIYWSQHPGIPYKPVVAWELGNEPNLTQENSNYGGNGVVNPSRYGNFLVYMSNAVRTASNEQAGRGTMVLVAGLYLGDVGQANMHWQEFLNKAYAVSGFSTSFDGVSIHPYGFDVSHPTGKTAWEYKQETEAIRAYLNAKGQSGKTLWVTEIGWGVSDSGTVPTVTEQEQEKLLNEVFDWTQGKAAAFGIESLIWYNLRDDPSQTTWAYRTGLLRADRSPRPIWYAFQAQTGVPSSYPSPERLPFVEEDSSAGPRVVQDQHGLVDVFYRTSSGGLGHDWFGPGQSVWGVETLGGSLAAGSDPDVVKIRSGVVHVFYRTPEGKLGHDWFGPGQNVWGVETLGGAIAAGAEPHALVLPNNSIQVFYRVPSNGLGHWWYEPWNPGWGAEVLPGTLSSEPHLTVDGFGGVNVFFRTPNGALGHVWHAPSGGTWGSETLAGALDSEPHAVADPVGGVNVFFRTSTGGLGHDWYEVGNPVWGSETLGGSLGLLRPGPAPEGRWLLRNANSTGFANLSFLYGTPEMLAVTGDWNGDGVDTPGMFEPGTGNWYLRNSPSQGPQNLSFTFGSCCDLVPIAGDWNNDGTDTVGLYKPSTGGWYLRNSNSTGVANAEFIFGGGGSAKPIAGDWNNDGTDTIGIYQPSTGGWFLRNANTTGFADVEFLFGNSAWPLPVAGDWNNDGKDTPGLYKPSGDWALRNVNGAGAAEAVPYFTGGFGSVPLAGDWNKDGIDTIGVAR